MGLLRATGGSCEQKESANELLLAVRTARSLCTATRPEPRDGHLLCVLLLNSKLRTATWSLAMGTMENFYKYWPLVLRAFARVAFFQIFEMMLEDES